MANDDEIAARLAANLVQRAVLTETPMSVIAEEGNAPTQPTKASGRKKGVFSSLKKSVKSAEPAAEAPQASPEPLVTPVATEKPVDATLQQFVWPAYQYVKAERNPHNNAFFLNITAGACQNVLSHIGAHGKTKPRIIEGYVS